jgi:hypothetical protein
LKAGGGLNDGPGKLDQSAIDRADSVVRSMSSLYPKEIKNILSVLNKEWAELKETEEGARNRELVEKISNTANHVKDLASTFGYDLMSYFGESLRDYILETELSMKEHYIIVQAHIDVMMVAFRENLKDDDGGPVAVELKKVVRQAIQKYSPDYQLPGDATSEDDA